MFLLPADGGGQVPLCLRCKIAYNRMLLEANDQLEREINNLQDHMEASFGISGILPRYQERRPSPIVLRGGDVHLNNVNVQNSDIGMLNVSANVEMVDSAITILKQGADENNVGEALGKLTEGIVKSNLDAKIKSELMEILSVVAGEATLPHGDRRPAVVKPLLLQIGKYLMGAKALADLWNLTKPFLTGHFGIPDIEA
jgi:hypothetical protein